MTDVTITPDTAAAEASPAFDYRTLVPVPSRYEHLAARIDLLEMDAARLYEDRADALVLLAVCLDLLGQDDLAERARDIRASSTSSSDSTRRLRWDIDGTRGALPSSAQRSPRGIRAPESSRRRDPLPALRSPRGVRIPKKGPDARSA
jgi:hypothetical protein